VKSVLSIILPIRLTLWRKFFVPLKDVANRWTWTPKLSRIYLKVTNRNIRNNNCGSKLSKTQTSNYAPSKIAQKASYTCLKSLPNVKNAIPYSASNA
jgi:hypothetical protein